MVDRSYGVIPVQVSGLESHYLIVQHQAGHWGFPKGHPESGENALTAAKRELTEETGVRECTLNDQVFFTEQYRITKDEQVVIRDIKYFLGICHELSSAKASNEIVRLRWVTYSEGMDMLTFQTTRDVLEKVHSYLQNRNQALASS
jgi:8-oxo-dGTP pyrophosphatase MutT (NUDIX family)